MPAARCLPVPSEGEQAEGSGTVKLDGKVALVTGTSPNICGGIAEGIAGEGASVVAVDVRAEYAQGCARSIVDGGGRAIGVACDVTDEGQVRIAMERARESFGGVDVLVNGAVIFNRKGVLDMPLGEWRRQLDVILTGAFLFTKHVAALMVEQGRRGSIINIISTAGHQGEPWNVGYSTGKAGLLNFTRSAAMELATYGIRVNSLTPTATDPSEGVERAGRWGVRWERAGAPVGRGLLKDASRGIPLGSRPSPSDYAKAAVFLASDEARMITGTDLRVDAGAIARYWMWDPGA